MSGANPLWGAPRIHGELLKLGINVSSVRGREMGRPFPRDRQRLNLLAKSGVFIHPGLGRY